ncbi:hypothetical protein [Pseudomonas sp. zfem005]|uniref:hypothetical protein n=1 Tax=Pseudomonas sp. zfem005 TaxID=3078200 RepID=UPI0029291BC8|nr:hypothetical protein [Pseudomonas sp. zfem005]MDU9415002.1 hypothetical protein [Pseudomonas sp. zfem005]
MLPLCVHLDPVTNALVAAGEFTGECTGYLLITPADWAGSMTVAQLFALPDPGMAAVAFTTPFMLCLALAYVASAVGAVAGFWDSTQEEL